MGPRNGVPATQASRGAPRGDDPSRSRWVRFAKMRGASLSCPRPLRERAQWCAHELEWVRGLSFSKYPSPILARGNIEPPSPARGEGTIMPTALAASSGDIINNDTHSLVPTAHFLRLGFAPLLRSPESRGGRSAEKRSGAAAPVRRAHDAARQALARRLASHDAAIYRRK